MFGEKTTERYKGKEIPVWQSPKYKESRAKAIEIIDKFGCIEEGDFWILMNTINNHETMMYSGLIISHNGCLKLNDEQPGELRFKPSCVSLDKEGYNGSLVYTYCCPEQDLFEVGEASKANCKNDYPYAMAFKRLFDRVVLKLCKLAYSGVYSDSEADEFKQRYEDTPQEEEKPQTADKPISEKHIRDISSLAKQKGSDIKKICEYFHVGALSNMSEKDYEKCMAMLNAKGVKNEETA